MLTNETRILSDRADLRNCIWSNRRDELFYIFNSVIFYVDLSDEFNTAQAVQVDNPVQDVLMGIGDWVYYETVFKKIDGMWSSPRGTMFAYIWLNNSAVPDFTYIEYGEPDNFDNPYPTPVTYKYPKAGTSIPYVELRVCPTGYFRDAQSFLAPAELGNEPILASVGWVDDDHVAPMWLNRAQTKAVVQSCKLQEDQTCETILEMEEPNGWIEPDTLVCSQYPTVRKKCWIQGNVQGWQRLLEIDMGTKVVYAITPKESSLVELLGMDEMREELFVILTGDVNDSERGPIVRHLYKIPTTGELECISCNVLSLEGNKCTYATASFSKDLSHFALTCRGPDPSFSLLFSNGNTLTQLQTWEENKNVREKLQKYQKTLKIEIRVPIDDNQEAVVQLYLPPCYKKDSSKKYPMAVRVMGDRNYAQVTDLFSIGYAHYLAQTRGVISCFIDARGSGFKGTDIFFAIKNKLGIVNAEDNINVVRHLVKNYKFIDSNRIGIWGYGYGGYAAALTLAMDEDGLYQGGFSVAPITSFFYYAAIYTDRLTGKPQENREAYVASDLLQYASKILGKKYLLIHGTGDDNVHYQHSMLWAKALQRAGVIFDQRVSLTIPTNIFEETSSPLYLLELLRW